MQQEGKKQLLIIDPKNEISFRGPYDHVVTEYFTLKNPTESTIAFKVKTTAPKKYCVRPNNGIIAPNRTIQVAVMLQPGDLTQEKHKHKFMIQSVVVPNSSNLNQSQLNADEIFKAASPDEIIDSKFKCVFLDLVPSANNVDSALTSTTKMQQNLEPEHQSVGGGDSGDDYVNGANAISDNDDSEVINSNDPHVENQMIARSINKLASAYDHMKPSSIPSTTNTALSNPSNNQDVESKLKLAEEEIRMLKDKLQQVQQYASKFSSQQSATTTTSSSSAKSSSSLNNNDTLLDNNQLLLKIAAVVVLVSFIFGIIFGKMF